MPHPRRREEAEEWLRFSTEDLETAEILSSMASPKPRQALFHAQQAVEKALKAFLIFHDRAYPLTLNLTILADSCADLDQSLHGDPQPAYGASLRPPALG